MSHRSPECDLFISYRHSIDDDHQAVTSIAEQIRQQGVRVFLDVNNIRPFESITQTIQRDLARCKALMLYLTEDYLASRACVW